MLPQAGASRPPCCSRWATKEVTVVLPLVPVIPTQGMLAMASQASSTSPTTLQPRSRNWLRTGWSKAMPGLTTTTEGQRGSASKLSRARGLPSST